MRRRLARLLGRSGGLLVVVMMMLLLLLRPLVRLGVWQMPRLHLLRLEGM